MDQTRCHGTTWPHLRLTMHNTVPSMPFFTTHLLKAFTLEAGVQTKTILMQEPPLFRYDLSNINYIVFILDPHNAHRNRDYLKTKHILTQGVHPNNFATD